MAIYYTSDQHFHHSRIIEYCDRPFSSVEEMNETIIENYNSVVGKDDSCVMLGDIFFCKPDEAQSIMDRLNGRKVLILGNHDRFSKQKYLDIGFDQVEKVASIGNYGVLIHNYEHIKYHKQLKLLEDHEKPSYTICGHVHQNWKVTSPYENMICVNVGVDVWNFQPISLKEINIALDEYKGRMK